MKTRFAFIRILILIVMVWNLQAAVLFIAAPERFLLAFELSGIPGKTAIRGVGVLFLMWQVPYAFALASPVRNRLSLIEALIMQTVGFLGEGLLVCFLPPSHDVIQSSLMRFIIFDGAGILLLLFALILVARGKMRDTRIQEE